MAIIMCDSQQGGDRLKVAVRQLQAWIEQLKPADNNYQGLVRQSDYSGKYFWCCADCRQKLNNKEAPDAVRGVSSSSPAVLAVVKPAAGSPVKAVKELKATATAAATAAPSTVTPTPPVAVKSDSAAASPTTQALQVKK